jgi:hypothetical protein
MLVPFFYLFIDGIHYHTQQESVEDENFSNYNSGLHVIMLADFVTLIALLLMNVSSPVSMSETINYIIL